MMPKGCAAGCGLIAVLALALVAFLFVADRHEQQAQDAAASAQEVLRKAGDQIGSAPPLESLPEPEVELLVVWGEVINRWGATVQGIENTNLPLSEWDDYKALVRKSDSFPHIDKYRRLTDAVEGLLEETAHWGPGEGQLATPEERVRLGRTLAEAMGQYAAEIAYVKRNISSDRMDEILMRYGLSRPSSRP